MDFNGNTLEPVSPQGDVDHFDHCATPKRKTKAKPQKMTGISLFSGGGGLDIGVHEADFRTLACIELDSKACETLRHNQDRYFPAATIINSDLNAVSLDALMKQYGIKAGELDLLFGGPPCQNFTPIGKPRCLPTARCTLMVSTG